MSKNRSQNILLAEIMIAVLFFALCSTVMLEVFVAAKEYRSRSEIQSEALIRMEDLAEQMYVSEALEDLLKEEGFQQSGNEWINDRQEYRLQVSFEEKANMAGTLRTGYISLWMGEEEIAELPIARYIPGGASE